MHSADDLISAYHSIGHSGNRPERLIRQCRRTTLLLKEYDITCSSCSFIHWTSSLTSGSSEAEMTRRKLTLVQSLNIHEGLRGMQNNNTVLWKYVHSYGINFVFPGSHHRWKLYLLIYFLTAALSICTTWVTVTENLQLRDKSGRLFHIKLLLHHWIPFHHFDHLP
jgi:hypothetical protein